MIIHQNDIKTFAVHQKLDGFQTVCRGFRRNIFVGQHMLNDGSVILVIVHNQNATNFYDFGFIGVVCFFVRNFDVKIKNRTFSHFAFQGKFAAHIIQNIVGNGQSQTGSAVFFAHGTVFLCEGVENALLFFGWNSDSRIAHRKTQSNFVFGTFQFFDFKFDFALFGEFYRISQKVYQDLFDARFVDENLFGQTLFDIQKQFQIFALCLIKHNIDDLIGKFVHIVTIDVQFQFSGFNFRKIENVIDDAQ